MRLLSVFDREGSRDKLLISLKRPYARAAEILGMTESGVRTLVKRQRTSGAAAQQPTPATTIDNFTIGAIRRHVYARFANKEFLTVERLLDGLTADGILRPGTSESTLRRILHRMGFRYRSTQRKMYVRKETLDIVCRRIQALRKLKQHRENGHQIVYVDETWFTTRMCHSREWVDNTQAATSATYSRQVPPGDGERFIVVAAGSEEGTIDGSFLSFVSKNRSGDYHGEMNSELFIRWLTSHLLPSLSRPSALVLDNAPYHSVLTEESRCPTSATRKADLINWLTQRDIPVPPGATRPELLLLCQQNKPEPQFVVDNIIREWGHEVVRLPPGHPELNAIEQVWGCMKRHGVLRSKASLRGLYDIRHRHPDVQFLMTSHLSQGCPENLLVLTACC
ncbi:hypothetical protein FJT64_026213 [Amphibalanus amphitrite]|uniref:Tc1-like transposase DDE domain-containing protein n=1 Tax=Amphibalanus amphitrite TaxID=1232801 RepID=A0A6A4W6E4_AMPAM|nr:hypothetical protein FJT64_026213 [Amphibalanus amphitrite]